MMTDEFDRAVDVEALRLAKKPDTAILFDLEAFHSQKFCIEREYLLRRLKSVDTGHHQTCHCKEGTHESLLGKIISWATDDLGQKNECNTSGLMAYSESANRR